MSSPLPSVAPDSAVPHLADAIEVAPAKSPRVLALRGCNIGILCADPQRPDVMELQRVATGMGARVALVRPDLGHADERTGVEQMARVLTRLYDAVLCFDLPPAIVQQLGETAAVPVVCADGGWLCELPADRPEVEDRTRLVLSQLASLCA